MPESESQKPKVRNFVKRPNIIIVDDIEECNHSEKHKRVLEAFITCEITQLVCSKCGDAIEPPKTEC
jgi:hypothetical protein